MIASIFIEPHERVEAAVAYGAYLTVEQSREIVDAPDEALVHLNIDLTARTSIVTVIEEG